MLQKVWVPDPETFDREVKARLNRAEEISQPCGRLNGAVDDLLVLQKAIDILIIPVTNTVGWQALGIAFGRVLKNELMLEWVMVDDEYGRDPALRYPQSETLLFPLTMLSKRLERGERPDVSRLFRLIRTDMATRYHKMLPSS